MVDWEKRSDTRVEPEYRSGPRILDEQELAEAERELSHPKAPPVLRHKSAKQSRYTEYQQTGVTDPNHPTRYEKLNKKIVKLMPHKVKMKKGYLLRRSGVAFRYEQQGEKEVTGPSFSTNRGTVTQDKVAQKEAGGLPIRADKPSAHKERRERAGRIKRTTMAVQGKSNASKSQAAIPRTRRTKIQWRLKKVRRRGEANQRREEQGDLTEISREKEL